LIAHIQLAEADVGALRAGGGGNILQPFTSRPIKDRDTPWRA